MALIEVKGVSKLFRRNTGSKLLRDRVLDLFRKRGDDHCFHALRDVSFTVDEGEAVALIGQNGAGKSTMLSLVTGLAKPEVGSINVNGRVAALMELGSGFHPDLTGEENVYLNAALLGFSERNARARFADIVEFSELGDFIYSPLRTYSSGMMVRLAFSVAVHADPAILIVDEVLGVGDAHFQEKCTNRISELRRSGVTMLCVSHSAHMVTTFCDRAIWLHHGELIRDGNAPHVLNEYLTFAATPGMEVSLRSASLAVTS
jgi:lipopolysaccharide transport system ATP-binding protein